ncbi:MAG TPA: Uma2 family endonuclease [Planctomycetaceae bacterium]|nr:Uma2 family endonuclease [Planctomycetaceae bacterium]
MPYRFSVDQYHRMIAAGVFGPDDRAELLDGWVIPKMPHNPPHDATIQVAEDALRQALSTGWRVRVQLAMTTDDSEPEPDLAVVRGHVRSYSQRHARPADIGVVIEVADSTLLQDRSVKGPLYARARVAVYWIINLIDESVEVYSDPTGPSSAPVFRTQQTYGRGDSVPLVLDSAQIALIPVDDLLP